MSSEEYLDLVDENDRVISREKRSIIYEKGLKNYRVVNVFIKNSKDQLWIPRRTNKKMFPYCLDMSMGGHVSSKESYEEALARELREELNLDVKDCKIKLLGYINPFKDIVSSFMKVYEIQMDDTPKYNKKDFSEYYWLTSKEILQKIAGGEKTKYDFPILIKKFYI